MSIPDDLLAVAALHRAMAALDYAGAARLVTKQATLDGLTALAQPAWRTAAEQAYRESVAAWRAEHEASVQRQQERDVAALVALVAEIFSTEPEVSPVSPDRASRNRDVLTEALRGEAA
jgi:hypothetical protein